MSRIERSYENCEIYDNLQDHLQSLCNLFKELVTRIEKITKFTKTAKFMIIR